LAFALTGILVILFGLQQLWSPDFGIHLATGRWILEHRAFPSFDVFSYTANASRDIDLWWIYHVFLAVMERLGGYAALVVSNMLLTLASFGFVVYRALKVAHGERWNGGGESGAGVLALLLLFGALTLNYEVRPHVLSWLFLQMILFVLERYWEDRTVPLWPLPVLQCLWLNSQPQGAVGYGILVAALAGTAFRDRAIDRRLLAYVLIAGGTSLVNPYFVDGLSLPLKQLGFIQSPTVFKESIQEFVSPFTLDEYRRGGRPVFLQGAFRLQLYFGISVLGILLAFRRSNAPRIGVFLVLAATFALSLKNFGVFFFGTLPFVYAGFAQGLAPKPGTGRGKGLVGRALRWCWAPAAAGALLAALLVRTNGYYTLMESNLRFGVELNESRLPVAVVEFIRANDLRGRILNTHDFGGYLMATLPQPVFVDGRHQVYGEEFFRSYLSMRTPGGMDAAIRRYDPDMVLVQHAGVPQWLTILASRRGWRMAAYDDVSALFLKNGYAPSIPGLSEEDALARTEAADPAVLDRVLSSEPGGFVTWLPQALWRPQSYPNGEVNRAIMAHILGWKRLAIRHAERAILQCTKEPGPLFKNLGHFNFEAGDYQSAARSFMRFLKTGDDSFVDQRLREAQRLSGR
jgi:hypothetical protein